MLDALMRLFALFAAGGSGREAMWGRQAASRYLRGRLAKSTSDHYLLKYDLILSKFNARCDGGTAEKTLAKLSVKLMRTCAEINHELELKERLVVYARLAEFTKATGQPVDSESFLTNVAEALHLPADIIHRIDQLVSGQSEDPEVRAFSVQDSHDVRAVRGHEDDLFFVTWQGGDGATLNSVPLPRGVVMPFSPGSVIKAKSGESLFFSELARLLLHANPTEPLRLEARGLAHRFRRPATDALHSLDFSVEGGMLVGLMGASGSGKSTLLNVLNGNITPAEGEVLLNGFNLHKEAHRAKGILGYVAQEDVLFSELTVFENLRFAAALSFRDASEEWLDERTDNLLKRLGLWHARDLQVGSVLAKTISGGQRKRLNIALELIRSPRILFVDEPTSGLSSRDSEHIMDLLKELTHRGTLVIVVIHQPSSEIFKLFDHLLILDTGGYPVYQGHPLDSLAYFKNLSEDVSAADVSCVTCGHVNPEQVFNILEARMVDEWGHLTDIRKTEPKVWHQFYLKAQSQAPSRSLSSPVLEDLHSEGSPSWIKQFRTFLARDLRAKSKNRSYLLLNALEAPALAGLLALFLRFSPSGDAFGYGTNENFPQFLFISVIVALFIGLSISAEEIIRDRAVLRREQFLHLNWRAYFFSKVVVMWGWSALSALSYVVVSAGILHIRDAMGWLFLVLFSLGAFANMLGLFISSVLKSVKVIYISIPLLIIPQIIFGGAIVRFDRFNPMLLGERAVPWIGEVMASRWGFEALAVELGRGNAFDSRFVALNDRIERAAWRRDFWYRGVLDLSDPKVQEAEWARARAELKAWGWPADALATPEALRDAYREAAKEAFAERDQLRMITGDFQAEEAAHRNASLRDWMMQTDRTKRLRIVEDGVLPLGTMIHQHPEFLANGSGGVGFYQPTKPLLGTTLPTPAFNLLVLWAMTAILGIVVAAQDLWSRFRGPRSQ